MRTILTLILVASAAWAQTESYGNTANASSIYDLTAAAITRTIKSGASDPATCTLGKDLFVNTASTPVLKLCTATNTWTALGGGSAGDIILDMTLDGSGVAIETTAIAYRRAWAACTVAEWSVIVVGGTITVDVLRIADGSTLPTASIVGAGTKPNVASGGASRAAPSSWTSTSIAANDLLAVQATAATATWAQISLRCTR